MPRLGYRSICPVQEVCMQQPADEPVDTHIDLPFNRFPEGMFLRLAVAIMLALVCQFVVFYFALPAAISH